METVATLALTLEVSGGGAQTSAWNLTARQVLDLMKLLPATGLGAPDLVVDHAPETVAAHRDHDPARPCESCAAVDL